MEDLPLAVDSLAAQCRPHPHVDLFAGLQGARDVVDEPAEADVAAGSHLEFVDLVADVTRYPSNQLRVFSFTAAVPCVSV
jgi:hypothetical protein